MHTPACPNEETILAVDGLTVNFRTDEGLVQAVRDVSFTMKRGRVLAIVGESGSGKSVTAYSILRLIQKPGRIDGGRIRLYPEGREAIDIAALSERDDLLYEVRGGLIAMIFQEPSSALSPVHTVGNQICEAILMHQKVSRREAEATAIAMLAKVGIPMPEMRLKQYPYEMSGGMRQRVVIAMALVCRPQLLICDEPTTALDVTIQAQILELIRDLQREMGTSVLFITHDIGVVAQIADDVAVMYRGRIVERGTVREVLKDPLHPYTRGLLAAIPGLNAGRRRLPTIASVIAESGADLSIEHPLRELPGGRLVALAADDLPAGRSLS